LLNEHLPPRAESVGVSIVCLGEIMIKKISKIRSSLQKVDDVALLLIPHRIAHRCIVAAKTNDAKIKLVSTALYLKDESIRRSVSKVFYSRKQHDNSFFFGIFTKIKGVLDNISIVL
jgi:hypothetical protein